MKIGILSDTHNNTVKILKAVDFFNLRNADLVVHAGDFSLYSSAKLLSKLKAPFISVFGNNDFEEYELKKVIEPFGIIEHQPYTFTADGKTIVLMHRLYGNYANADFVIFGHTHIPEIRKYGGQTFINPGECAGRRYGRSTVAELDTTTGHAEIFDLDEEF